MSDLVEGSRTPPSAVCQSLPGIAADAARETLSRRAARLCDDWRDSGSGFWSGAAGAVLDRDNHALPVPQHRTEVRSRWTARHIYFLFICQYKELHLKPSPRLDAETNELWNWDVAEVFIGADFHNIRHYREFEVSPQGEWVDLDVDLSLPRHEDGWIWSSGIAVAACIEASSKVWYGAMRIPYESIDPRPAAAGNALRMNLFRAQGPGTKPSSGSPRARKPSTCLKPSAPCGSWIDGVSR